MVQIIDLVTPTVVYAQRPERNSQIHLI